MSLLQLVRRAVTPKSHQISWSNPLLLSAILAIYYSGIMGVNNPAGDGKLYGELADAFLAGQTYLLRTPSEEILSQPDPRRYAIEKGDARVDDLLLYKDRFYIFYGPVPALLLFAPFKYLTGEQMDSRFAAWLITTLGTIAAVALMMELAKRLAIENRPQQIFIAFMLAIGTFIPYQLKLGSYYQVAIGSAYLFTALAFYALVRAFAQPSGNPKWLATASLCFGLAMGCRIHFGSAGLLLLLIGLAIGRASAWRWDCALWQRAVALALPFAACVAVLAVYNYARFDTPFSTGILYQISFNIIPPISVYNSLLNAYLAFFHPIPLSWEFPFFHPYRCCPMPVPWWSASTVSPTQETAYGAFTNAPFLCMLLLAPKLLRAAWQKDRLIGWVLICLLILSAVITLPSLIWVGVTMRYLVDFAPWLMVLAGLSYLYALKYYEHRPHALSLVRGAGMATGLYTLACGFVIGFIGY